ncbi:MAG: BatA and WFA domain-containing protein [Planctomycetes bacterium]|jgi:hypothetical protein|nr:BatA and WFA domain-containing protein [Planctomycetota bacterium]
MIFAASTFLVLLPLAGLPIVFHLVLKQKKRTIVFSTLMFFHRVDPKLNSHRKIREWLLLALRVLMIALLLLALSRPALRSTVGAGGKLSLVALIDNSGSMTAGAQDSDLTKLECAKEGTRQLLMSLAPAAEAALVLSVEDATAAVPESLTADRQALRECLDRIGPTEASGDTHRALARAFALLRQTTAGGGAVHVFTDLQQAEWGEAAKRFEAREDRIQVILHRIGTAPRPEANVAVTGIQFPEQRILVGQPYEVGVSLRNNSSGTADIRINCINGQGAKSTQNLSLQSQQVTTVRLPITANEQGFHWLRAWVEGDGFAADNAAGIGLFCEGIGAVLFVGAPAQFGVLPMALSPGGRGELTGLATQFAPALQLDPAQMPLLVVTTWEWLANGTANTTTAMKYVEAGGNLLVVPSLSRGSAAAATQTVDGLGAGLRARETHKSGVRLEILNRSVPFWRQIEPIVGDLSAEPIAAYAFCPLEFPSGFTSLLGAGAGKIVLAQRQLGQGNLFVSGLAFSSRWSTLPLSGLGVVMVQRLAVCSRPVRAYPETPGSVPAQTSHILPLVAGERPSAWPAGQETEILSLAGDPLEWKGRPAQAPAFARTGVYLATTGDQKCCISVRASDKEGEDRFLAGSDVPILGPVDHTVVAFDPDSDYTRYHAGQARVIELYLPLLLLATLAVLFEGLLGTSRVRSSAGRSSPVAGPVLMGRET